MNTSCFRKEEKRIEAQWENTLLLPGCAGMPENVGLAGAYSGIVEGKLLVLGGANSVSYTHLDVYKRQDSASVLYAK